MRTDRHQLLPSRGAKPSYSRCWQERFGHCGCRASAGSVPAGFGRRDAQLRRGGRALPFVADMSKSERIRDPIHDLIVFDEKDDLGVDSIAWALIQTPEFQRLRRIKQLGVSEFVYPGATHTRFAHCVGVFHNARRLLGLIKREIANGRVKAEFDGDRAKIAVLAALLHDIGHGPFSHTFEGARKLIADKKDGTGKGKIKRHETWTAEIIENPGGTVAPILEKELGKGTASAIATLLGAETPTDFYHAIVSSSFDADRLDYIQRDRYMTGTGMGTIDLSWLLDNVRIAEIDITPPSNEGEEPVRTYSFCLTYKGREAAEDFLLARYRLYSNVYLHKTTRGIEQLLSAVFEGISASAETKTNTDLGLSDDHPLVAFFAPGGETVENYLALDDGVVWGSLERLSKGKDKRLQHIASRILNRDKPSAIDIQGLFPGSSEHQRRAQHWLDAKLKGKLGESVFKDAARLSLYGEVGADDERAHKRIMIQLANGDLREITEIHEGRALDADIERRYLRYYFLNESERDQLREAVKASVLQGIG